MSFFVFPKPSDPEIFEDIVCDVFSREFNNRNLQRYGRRGQKQKGVDVAGLDGTKVIGLQCKNHPDEIITIQEIDEEVNKSEAFAPPLDELIIATSSNRDVHTHAHVLEVTQKRIKDKKYPVNIKFWDEICNLLLKYPDLVYKYFSKYFPKNELETVKISSPKLTKTTTTCPTNFKQLSKVVNLNIDGLDKTDPYFLTLGVSTFSDTSFDKLVDLDIQLANLFSQGGKPDENFTKAADLLNQVKSIISDPFFSKDLTIYLQSRLTASLLLGWVFRKVTKFQLTLISSEQVWRTEDLPFVNPKLFEDFPTIIDEKSDEAVLVLNISREIKPAVEKYVANFKKKPKVILSYGVEGKAITNAAHALSVSLEISRKIKTLIDVWGVKRIHLFGAMPSPLATLIGYHLNAICPISLYFLDDTRKQYQFGGELTNNL